MIDSKGAHASEPPPAVERGWRDAALVWTGAVAVTVLLTYPFAFHLATLGRTNSTDGQFSVWNVAWVARALVLDPLHVFDANIFYPHRWTLLYSEANLGAGVLAVVPYWLSGNPYVAHNVVVLLSFVLSAAGMFYLVRYLTRDATAAAVSAICFAFCPYVLSHLPHIQLLMTAGLPFSMLAFHRLVDRPSLGRAGTLGAVMAAQAWACGYYGIYAMLFVGFSVLFVAFTRRRFTDARFWIPVAGAAFVAIAGVAPLLWLYASLQRTTGFTRTLADGRAYAAGLSDYLASSAYAHSWMLKWLSPWIEVAFPGVVATVLGTAGIFVAMRSDSARPIREVGLLYLSLGVLAWWASTGPSGILYAVLFRVIPGFSLVRAPSRFAVLVAFALSVLAGVAIARLTSRSRQPLALAGGLVALALADVATPLQWRAVPPVDPAYRVLAGQVKGPVLELPVYSRRFASQRSTYMLASTMHWMPLVDAYSDYVPEDFSNSLQTLGDFPTRESFALLEPIRPRYAVFHVDKYPADSVTRLRGRIQEFAPYLRGLWMDDRTWLYEISGFPPAP